MEAMMIVSEFGKPPFIFKGSALYQLHVVKAEIVRPFIPKELKIVETLGYTVGGFFLANYEDSPFGAFDELVVMIAGIVRNNQSSCAWAANVFVNNDEARDSGRKEFGLPSQVANFSKKTGARREGKPKGFLNSGNSKNYTRIKIKEINDEEAIDSCNLSIQTAETATGLDFNKFISPEIKLSLPSLSGLTKYNPHLLEYICQIEARVKVVGAAKISNESESEICERESAVKRIVGESRPIVAIQFNSMKMTVNSPTLVSQYQHLPTSHNI